MKKKDESHRELVINHRELANKMMILESRLSCEGQYDDISLMEDNSERIEALELAIYEKDIELKDTKVKLNAVIEELEK